MFLTGNLLPEFQYEASWYFILKEASFTVAHRTGQVIHVRPLVQSLTQDGGGPHASVRAPDMGSE